MHALQVERLENNLKLEGRHEGAIEMLLYQLQRFGHVPDWARDKMAKADLPTLKAWSLRLVNARFLEDVFED